MAAAAAAAAARFPAEKATCLLGGEPAVLITWIRSARRAATMKYFIIDYLSLLQERGLIRGIEATPRSAALTSNPFLLIKGKRVNLINAY